MTDKKKETEKASGLFRYKHVVIVTTLEGKKICRERKGRREDKQRDIDGGKE